MEREARVVAAITLTVLAVPIVIVNGVLYNSAGVEAVAVWLGLEALFCTLTGLVIVRLPTTHTDRGISERTERHYDRSQGAKAAYRTLQHNGQVSKQREGFDALIRLLNRGTSLAGGGDVIAIDGPARDPRRARIEVDGVPLDLTLARVESAVETYEKRTTERREAERTRSHRRYVLVGTSVLVMSMLLELAAVLIID